MSEYRGDARAQRLVNHLLYLARTLDEKPESRAALAELRQATQNPLRAAKHVVPHLLEPRPGREEAQERLLYNVASLFAYHRKHAEGVSLGRAFRQINDDSGSVERRFLQLLAADTEHLTGHLRHAVRLLESRDVSLDWYRLTNDVLGWDHENKPKQHALARDFYRAAALGANDPNAPAPPNPAQGDNP